MKVEYETEEQQVQALKDWWSDNGRAVIAGVVLGVGVIGGWSLWQGHTEKKTMAAGDSYSRTLDAVSAGNFDEALNGADQAQSDNSGHLYASYANFAAARAAVESNDLEEAAKRLEWVVDNAPQEDVKLIAQVRLARVIGANGDASGGLSTLPDSFPESFAGLVEEARGDLHVIAGDIAAAREAYNAAADSEFIANREGLSMKIDDLADPAAESDDASESTS